jgi:hypothetical protein
MAIEQKGAGGCLGTSFIGLDPGTPCLSDTLVPISHAIPSHCDATIDRPHPHSTVPVLFM